MGDELKKEAMQLIRTYINMYPGLVELEGDVPYFVDRSITPLPLTPTLILTKLVRVKWDDTKARAILSIDRKISSLVVLSDEKRISEESCIALYKMGVALTHTTDDDTGVDFYNKKEIMRKYTIADIIKEEK